MLRLGALFIGCGVILACSPPALCPGGAEYPVRVELLKDGEHFTNGADVTYVLDGGTEQDCIRNVDDGHAYNCGTDRIGEYEITVTINGRQDVYETVNVDMDGCRLGGQTVALEIGAPCEDKEVVSVHVLVVDAADSNPIDDAVVKYQPVEDEGGLRFCEEADEPNGWNCGVNTPGNVKIVAQKTDYENDIQIVYVEEDSCDVITKEHVVRLKAK